MNENKRSKYVKVAENPEGLFKYPTGRAGMEALGYDFEPIRSLPEAVIASYFGAGNPFSVGPISR
jgi:arsenite methyltransferase